jgi:hypothetical protein
VKRDIEKDRAMCERIPKRWEYHETCDGHEFRFDVAGRAEPQLLIDYPQAICEFMVTAPEALPYYINRTEASEKRVAKLEATLQEATRILRSIVTHRIILRMCKGCDEFPCQGDIRVICIFQKLMSDIDTYLCKAKEDDTKSCTSCGR